MDNSDNPEQIEESTNIAEEGLGFVGFESTQGEISNVLERKEFIDIKEYLQEFSAFLSPRESRESTIKLLKTYEKILKLANNLSEFPDRLKLPEEGRTKLEEAFEKLDPEFIKALAVHFEQLELLCNELIKKIRQQGYMAFLNSTTDQSFDVSNRIKDLLKRTMELMLAGSFELSKDTLSDANEDYKTMQVGDFISHETKIKLMGNPQIVSEHNADTVCEIASLRRLLEELKTPLMVPVVKDGVYAKLMEEIENSNIEKDTYSLLIHLFKRTLTHHQNSIASQKYALLGSEEYGIELSDILKNKGERLLFILSLVQQILTALKLTHYQTALLRESKY